MRGTVFGNTFENAQKKFMEIASKYESMGIGIEKPLIKTKHELKSYFTNGDFWSAIAVANCGRGRRCNIAYIDDEINPHVVDTIIKLCLTASPYCAYNYFHIWTEEELNEFLAN